jgi:hypothetical protein
MDVVYVISLRTLARYAITGVRIGKYAHFSVVITYRND